MVDPDDRQRARAAAALADIEQQRLFVSQRLGGFSWLAPVVAVVLALAAASLAYRNGAQGYGERMRQMDVRFVVVQVIYLAAFIPLVGTPFEPGSFLAKADKAGDTCSRSASSSCRSHSWRSSGRGGRRSWQGQALG